MPKRTANSPNRAYIRTTNFYDDVLTVRKWWSHIYMNCIWKVDDKSYCEIYRVLKRGGIFLGCFYVRGERRIADWIVRYVLCPNARR